MTEAEVLEIIKRKSSIPMGNETFDEIEEAYDIAIKSLGKQIPKKMAFTPKYFPCDYQCPNGCKQYEAYKINYCPTCGQKIDWE